MAGSLLRLAVPKVFGSVSFTILDVSGPNTPARVYHH